MNKIYLQKKTIQYSIYIIRLNYKDDKLCHPTQKPRKLLEHLVWLSDADHENYVIGDFFAGSGSLLRAVNKADVILCDLNDEYYDKFFDIYVTDERIYRPLR